MVTPLFAFYMFENPRGNAPRGKITDSALEKQAPKSVL